MRVQHGQHPGIKEEIEERESERALTPPHPHSAPRQGLQASRAAQAAGLSQAGHAAPREQRGTGEAAQGNPHRRTPAPLTAAAATEARGREETGPERAAPSTEAPRGGKGRGQRGRGLRGYLKARAGGCFPQRR